MEKSERNIEHCERVADSQRQTVPGRPAAAGEEKQHQHFGECSIDCYFHEDGDEIVFCTINGERI